MRYYLMKRFGADALVYLCFICRDMLAEAANEYSLPHIFLGDVACMALGEIDAPVNNDITCT